MLLRQRKEAKAISRTCGTSPVQRMHKGTTILVILASLGIIALIGLGVLVTYISRMEAPISNTSAVSLSTEAAIDELNPTAVSTKGTTAYGDADYQEAAHQFIFVGDSRTVAMKDAVYDTYPDDTCRFIAKEGEGYQWLNDIGIVQLDELLQQDPEETVIFNLGVNDLEAITSYINFYQEIFAAYPEATFYIMSINPVESDKYPNISAEDIQSFNTTMQDAFPSHYLDCYSYLVSENFTTIDGLHYPDDVSLKIHHYAVMMLSN